LAKKKKPLMDNIKWHKVSGFGSLYEFKEQGDEVIGDYQGARKAANGNLIHTVTAIDGEDLSFWGSGLLDKILSDESLKGRTLKIVYQGKKKVKIDIDGKKKTTNVRQYDVYTAEV